MGLCLINHVHPLCFTSEAAAALGLINGAQSALKRRLVTGSSEYTALRFDAPVCVEQHAPQQMMMSPAACGFPAPALSEDNLLQDHLWTQQSAGLKVQGSESTLL